MNWKTGLYGAALVAALLTPSAHALVLTPGTIIGGDAVAPGGSVFTLVQYSPTGTILDTLLLTDTVGLGVMDGVAIVGNSLYVTGTNGVVGQVNLTTGVVSNGFNVGGGGVEALGNMNGNLLVGSYSGNTIRVYSTAGALLNTITPGVSVGMTGIDSDGTNIFMASYDNGNIYTLNSSGGVIGSFASGLGGSSLSGLGYDSFTNTLWVSSGFNQDLIRQYSLSGTLLASFPANWSFIDGLDVVPVPEPTTLASILMATAALGMVRRIR